MQGAWVTLEIFICDFSTLLEDLGQACVEVLLAKGDLFLVWLCLVLPGAGLVLVRLQMEQPCQGSSAGYLLPRGGEGALFVSCHTHTSTHLLCRALGYLIAYLPAGALNQDTARHSLCHYLALNLKASISAIVQGLGVWTQTKHHVLQVAAGFWQGPECQLCESNQIASAPLPGRARLPLEGARLLCSQNWLPAQLWSFCTLPGFTKGV